MARGRTNLDGYLLTHTAFCYRTELSLAYTRARKYNRLANSLPPAHYLSSPPSRQYCIVLKPRLVLRLDKSRRTTYPAVSSSILPPSLHPFHRNPPATLHAQHPVVLQSPEHAVLFTEQFKPQMTDILNVLLARSIDHSDSARLGSCHLVMRDSRNRRINARTQLAENT